MYNNTTLGIANKILSDYNCGQIKVELVHHAQEHTGLRLTDDTVHIIETSDARYTCFAGFKDSNWANLLQCSTMRPVRVSPTQITFQTDRLMPPIHRRHPDDRTL